MTGLPPIDQALLPADIRTATPQRRDTYVAALGFERMLVQQLAKQVAGTARSALGGSSPYAAMLPDAMADGIVAAGGLGLARELTDAIVPAPAGTHEEAR